MHGYLTSTTRQSWLPFVFAALMTHGALCLLTLIARTPAAQSPVQVANGLAVFRLIPPAEGNSPVYIASSNPGWLPPEGSDSVPDVEASEGDNLPTPAEEAEGMVSDADVAEILAREREALRLELEQMTQLAAASPLPESPIPVPPPEKAQRGASDKGPEGAIRELDLDGYPQKVVEDIMKRYKLKVVTQRIEGGRRGQSFLSSATRGDSERYFGGMAVPSGVYEVFQLSRDSVALMSRLEEEALKAKGLEPLKSRVIRIVFGIVEDEKGNYTLGVKSLEAEAVAP